MVRLGDSRKFFLIFAATCFLLGLLIAEFLDISHGLVAPGSLSLATALAGFTFLLTLSDIRFGIGLVILGIALSPEFSLGDLSNLRLEDFIIPIVLVVWTARLLIQGERPEPGKLTGPLLLYLGACLWSTLIGILFSRISPRSGMLTFLKLTEYVMLYLLFVTTIRTTAEIKFFLAFTLLAASASAAYGTIQSFETFRTPHARVTGPRGETTNIFAGFVGMFLCILIGLWAHAPTMRGRLGLLLLMVPFLWTLLFTQSRTTYVATLVGVTLFGLIWKRRVIILAGIVLAALSWLVPEVLLERTESITTATLKEGPESWVERLIAWRREGIRFLQNPLWGYGLSSVAPGDVDNEYIRILVETGVLGMLGFLWLMARIGKLSYQTYDRSPDDPILKGTVAGFLMAYFAMLVHMIGATSLTSIRTAETFFLLTALMVAASNRIIERTLVPETDIPSIAG